MLLILQLIPVYSHVADEVTGLLALISVQGIDAHSIANSSRPRLLKASSKLKVYEPTIQRLYQYVCLQDPLQFEFEQIYMYSPCHIPCPQTCP